MVGLGARLQQKLKEGRQAVNQLRRANEGERGRLLQALLMVYGRTGKRRHELVQPLLPVAGPAKAGASLREEDGDDESPASETVASTPQTGNVDVTSKASPARRPNAQQVNEGARHPYVPELSPQMLALLESQVKSPPPHVTRATLRRIEPRLAEQNSWLRDMPLRRVEKATKKWYAALREKVHPPLPTQEWERLRDLANGSLTEPIVPRRAKPHHHDRDVLADVVMYGKPDAHKLFGNKHAHTITPRFMQRLWGQVFAQCPRLDWDVQEKRWKATWGEHAMHAMGPSDLADADDDDQ